MPYYFPDQTQPAQPAQPAAAPAGGLLSLQQPAAIPTPREQGGLLGLDNQALLELGISLLGGSDVGKALSGAFGSLSERQKMAQDSVYKQFQMQVAQLQAAQEAQKIGIQQQQFLLDKQKYGLQAGEDERKQSALAELQQLTADYQAGNMTPSEYQAQIAPKLAVIGSPQGLLSLAEGTYGSVQEGVDENGKPVLYLTNKAGETKVLPSVQPADQQRREVNKQLAQVDATQVAKGRENAQLASSMLYSLDQLDKALAEVKDIEVGPVAGWANSPNPKIQTLSGLLAQVTQQAKSILGIPNANFSNADLEFLKQAAAGDVYKDRPTLVASAKRLREMAVRTIQTQQAQESYLAEKGTLLGAPVYYQQQQANTMPMTPAAGQPAMAANAAPAPMQLPDPGIRPMPKAAAPSVNALPPTGRGAINLGFRQAMPGGIR